MTDDTTNQGQGNQQQGGDQGAQGGAGGSMLDVEKIKAGNQGDQGTQQQGGQDKTVTAGADGTVEKKGDADQPGQKQTRPEWLTEDKFWDAEKGEVKTDLMFKNLGELQKMVSKGDHKAPEKPEGYKVASLSTEHKELLFGSKDADPHQDPLFQKAAQWGVKNKISQAAMDEFLNLYAEATAAESGQFKIDAEAERKALGKNADALIQNQHEFFEQMFKAGEIGEAELKEAQILFETAAGVKLVQAIRKRYGEQAIPTDPNPNMDGVPSAEELGKMVVDQKYGVDKDFTAKVDGWYAKRYGSKPAMSSVVNR